MNSSESGASAPSSAAFSEITVKRDGERPLVFSGKTLAKVSMQFGLAVVDPATMTAAVYVTPAGRYISTLSKIKNGIVTHLQEWNAENPVVNQTYKAQVSSTLEEAVAWFKPGRLTDALRDKLGLNEPERIE
jgi:hypothetical protein